jgi:hypothetical protein
VVDELWVLFVSRVLWVEDKIFPSSRYVLLSYDELGTPKQYTAFKPVDSLNF